MSEIPLFPLSSVSLPYGQMPLQIFEQRYLDLVKDCMRSSSGFGVVWVRRGAEVRQQGRAQPDLGDYGTYARIIDWDQLPNGLLGLTIQGGEIFELDETRRADNDLVMGTVRMQPALEPAPMLDSWQSLADVLGSLETHPHVQQMNLGIDYNNAWQVAFTLVQLLPLEESLKYELLGSENLDALIRELDIILNQISGED
ncbi:MAG: LON peptidase substrate-binding domain-containing protein [Halieaceae bacterium]